MEILDLAAAEKMKIPSHLRDITIDQLRAAGATIGPDVSIPESTDNHFRNLYKLRGKFGELQAELLERIKSYYAEKKRQIPKDTLDKEIRNLNDHEWALLGPDMAALKRS